MKQVENRNEQVFEVNVNSFLREARMKARKWQKSKEKGKVCFHGESLAIALYIREDIIQERQDFIKSELEEMGLVFNRMIRLGNRTFEEFLTEEIKNCLPVDDNFTVVCTEVRCDAHK